MTRGNQRELDRARAAARREKALGKETKGGDPRARREADAAALQAKVAAKAAAAAAAAAGGGGAGGAGGAMGGAGGPSGKK
jgi:hypothetical protein